MSSPTYRWSCHKCRETNEAGSSVCSHCGFPAHARGVEIEPATNSATNSNAIKRKKAGMTGVCPKCRERIDVPNGILSSGPFSCSSCGVALVSNHALLYIATLVVWTPLVIWSYQHWLVFTLFVGDWLLLLVVGLVIFVPFHKLTVVGAHENDT